MINLKKVKRACNNLPSRIVYRSERLDERSRTQERNLYMKKTVTSIICTLILTLALAACGAGNGRTADKENGENVQIPAPWTDYNSVEEAEAQAGFDITAPERIGNYEFDFARVFDDGMLELIYTGTGGDSVSVRKAEGKGDISGDYNEYAESDVLEAGGVTVTAKGNGEGISLALWEADGYTYSMSAGETALTESDVVEAVSAVMGESA